MSHSILIIEDEITLAKNIRIFLTRQGFDVRSTGSGGEGLIELEQFQPDVILLDYLLGDMDGLQVLQQIRRENQHIKIILMTGQGNVQLAVDAMKAGAYDFTAAWQTLWQNGSALRSGGAGPAAPSCLAG